MLFISCSTTKENKKIETQQVKTELKQQQTYDKNRSENNEIKQKSESDQVNKQTNDSPQSSVKQQTNHGNYSGEIKNARTSQEKATQTEEELNASLRDFDEMLLEKNEELSALSKRGGGSAGSDSGNEGGIESGQGEQNGGGSVSTSGGSGQSVAGVKSQDKNFDNDDVIARQIREAAEKESDPELKKKLWIEYEKYKSESK